MKQIIKNPSEAIKEEIGTRTYSYEYDMFFNRIKGSMKVR